MSQTLVRYDAMCSAIAACHAVDEVKDIRDKALAIEVYARQAKNVEAETKACEIRLRAERRAGQMLGEMDKSTGGRPVENQSHDATGYSEPRAAKPLSDLGISKTQSSRWQKLAAIPEEDFEATFAKPERKPSTTGIIAAHKQKTEPPPPPKQASPHPKALWLWGRLLDFEREGILSADPNELFGSMLDHMKETTLELAPSVAAWLQRITP